MAAAASARTGAASADARVTAVIRVVAPSAVAGGSPSTGAWAERRTFIARVAGLRSLGPNAGAISGGRALAGSPSPQADSHHTPGAAVAPAGHSTCAPKGHRAYPPEALASAAKETSARFLVRQYWAALDKWARAPKHPRLGARARGFRVPAIGTASADELDAWDKTMTELGYTVARDGLFYSVTVPPPTPRGQRSEIETAGLSQSTATDDASDPNTPSGPAGAHPGADGVGQNEQNAVQAN